MPSRTNVRKPVISVVSRYLPGLRNRNRYWPAVFVSAVDVDAVSTLTSATFAPAIAEALGSLIVPLRVARLSCAYTAEARLDVKARNRTKFFRRIVDLFTCFRIERTGCT